MRYTNHCSTYLLIVLWSLNSCNSLEGGRKRIDLSGKWESSMGEIQLPGTTDEARLGERTKDTLKTTMLTRLYPFEGAAYYERTVDIPTDWQGKRVRLFMEKTKPSTVWIDGDSIGRYSHLHTPHVYELSQEISSGSHRLRIRIDNSASSVPAGIQGSHAWTNNTQTNWNGILGDFYLEAVPDVSIEEMQVYPDIQKKEVLVKVTVFVADRLIGKDQTATGKIRLQAEQIGKNKSRKLSPEQFASTLGPGLNQLEYRYPIEEEVALWSEFSPELYRMNILTRVKEEQDRSEVNFGMRKIDTRDTRFTLNENVIFLRGKHDGCVFPETGYAPMSCEEWQEVFRIAKSYGINHYRFHSWTPPRAAFEAADREGIYLQAELPYWGAINRQDTVLNAYLKNEGELILKTFGNHPSFTMFALGNELNGDLSLMQEWTDEFRKEDSRHLYSFGANNNLGTAGQVPGEDYFVTCRVGSDTDSTYSTHVRASFSFADAYKGGLLNGAYPSTNRNYSVAISGCSVPVVSHENCQFQIYPDYREIDSYTGVLYPYNLTIFKNRLKENHLEHQAVDFHRASGKLAMICYKADLEYCLRTPGFGGFQMLDLQDYPGQGSALVGILDAHMQSKGLITPEDFRQFCAPVVPLASFERYCWDNSQNFEAAILTANYSPGELREVPFSWKIVDQAGNVLAAKEETVTVAQGEVEMIDAIHYPLGGHRQPEKLNLSLKVGDAENSYDLWVYPAINDTEQQPETDGYLIRSLDNEAFRKLAAGASLLYVPDHSEIRDQSVDGMFTPDYWNYAMFKGISEWLKREVSPGTLSILTDPSHPLFAGFPTEEHTNWQWWQILRNSRPFILTDVDSTYRPLIQMVDNVERNHKLGLLFEFNVGKGKLLISMCDHDAVGNTPEGAAYTKAVCAYLHSADFQPTHTLSPAELKSMFKKKTFSPDIIEVRNITSYE